MKRVVRASLSPEQASQLEQQALEEGISEAEVVRRALKNYIAPVPITPVPPEPVNAPPITKPETPDTKRRRAVRV
jgi:ribbon-helix-helix CopG family protein